MEKKIKELDINKIIPNKNQPRKAFDVKALEELSTSIKTYGVIQPITVRKIDEDEYELIAGERRLKATKISGLKSIPAIIMDVENSDSAAMALIENLQREDLNFIEEAEAYEKIVLEFGITQNQLANKIGKTQSTVANKMRILKLPRKIKDTLVENNLSERHGRALLKLEEEEIQLKILNEIIKKDLNVSATEKLIQSIVEDIKKEDIKTKQQIKNFINYRIYVNTIKKAYEEIVKTGIDAKFEHKDNDDYLEIRVKIPKQNMSK